MSTPKALPQDLLDEGFLAGDFGAPADFTIVGTGYLARTLVKAGLWVAQQVSQAVYDAAPSGSYAESALRQAEVHYASWLLWTRRIKFIDGNATIGLQIDISKSLALFQAQAQAAYSAAFADIGEALLASGMDATGVIPGSYLSSATVETGPFPPASSEPMGVNALGADPCV